MSDQRTAKTNRFLRVMFALKEVGLVVLIVLSTRTALAEQYFVPSGSMEPTLAIGDRLLVPKFSYGYSRYSLPNVFGIPALFPASAGRFLGTGPERGDVVVFRLPRDPSQTYVKRVIGLPGDRVQMRAGRLWINGREVALRPDGTAKLENEDGSLTDAPRLIETLPNGFEHLIFKTAQNGELDNTEEFAVPAGHVFVMGDNRDDSLDSRVPPEAGGVGFVPLENLVGKADAIVASWDLIGAQGIRFVRFFSRVN